MFTGTLYQEKIKEAHMENSLQFFWLKRVAGASFTNE